MNTHTECSDKTPLHQAAILGCTEEVKKLISSGAIPDAQTRRGRTALHYAAEFGHKRILELLMKSGAHVNLPNKWGRTALHYAASKYRMGCVQTLLSSGADPNKQDVDGQTALYHAVAASASISYPESSGFLVSGATPGRLWGHQKNSIFLIGCSVTVSIVLPQKSCGSKI